MIKIVLSNLKRNKRRTFLTLLGVVIGVAAIISLVSVSVGLTQRSTEVLSSFQGVFVFEEEALDVPYSRVSDDLKNDVNNVPGVDFTIPEIWTNPSNLGEEFQTGFTSFIFIIGIDTEYAGEENIAPYYEVTEGRHLYPGESNKVVVGSGLVDSFDLSIGETFEMNDKNYQIVGVFDTDMQLMNYLIVTSLEEAREVSNFPDDEVTNFQVIPNNPEDVTRVKERIEARLGGEVQALSMQDSADMMAGFINNLRIALWIVSGIAGVVGGIGVMNTMLMSVMERITEFGVLKAVGWKDEHVMLMVVLEGLILSLIGGLIGVGLGFGVSEYVARVSNIPSVVDLQLILQAMLFAVVMGLVGSSYPAYKSAEMNPIEAVRGLH